MNEGLTSQVADLPEPPKSILVVDDEVLICITVADFLRECGYHVVEAANADEAVAILETSPVRIDLVFSDVQMPGDMDGLGLARWVRRYRPELPVILTSGTASTADLGEELCSIGPVEPKPHQNPSLANRIRSALRG